MNQKLERRTLSSRLTRSLDVLLCAASTSGLFALCVAVMSRRPENHVGFSPWLLTFPSAAVLVVDGARSCLSRRVRVSTVVIATVCVLTLASLLIADHWNVLVPYETWVKRGMPVAWH